MDTLLALDTEDDSRGNVKIINFFDGVAHHTFIGRSLRQDAWDYLKTVGKDYCWATNCEYDLANLYGFHWLGRIVTLQYVSSGLMRAFAKEAPVTFLDTLRHWPMSVEAMGEKLGYPKLKMPHLGCDCKQCREYCQRDTEVTFKFTAEMLERYEWLGLKLRSTLPSMAMQLFKKLTPDKESAEHNFSQGVIDLLRRSYYGGRVEVFKFKEIKGITNHYDVNSLFPSVMRGNIYPDLSTWRKTKKPDFSREGVCSGFVQIPNNRICCLPVRYENEILFPYGSVEGVWTYPEIRKLLELGGKIEPTDAVEFRETEKPFDEFIDFCYSNRLKAASELDKVFWKLMMNSLYGKFGQSRGITTIYFDRKKRQVSEREISSESKTSNVIWSAYVTSYARLRLLDYLRGTENVYYTDTDSLFTPGDLDTSTKLGELKLEGTYSRCEFKGNKIYVVDGRAKAKGVRAYETNNCGNVYSPASDFVRTGRATFRRPARFREARKTFAKLNVWYRTEKRMNSVYTKRKILRDGSTEAWNYPQYVRFVEQLTKKGS